MQLAIIGKISSSKSTLVNAILGKDGVMATGQMEVTYNAVSYTHLMGEQSMGPVTLMTM